MKYFLSILFISFLAAAVKAQNIFPKKLDNCITEMFCLDCGDEKANADPQKLEILLSDLSKSLNQKISGKVIFQVLVDSMGKGCVLSHTDVSNNSISQEIVKKLNSFDGWLPAKSNGKPEGRTSFNMVFEIRNGLITGKIERVDQKAFIASFDHPIDPEIYNKDYKYKNKNLKNYRITVWNTKNSNLSDNMNDHISIDKKGEIWMTTDEGLVVFDGNNFINIEKSVPQKAKYFNCSAIASDNQTKKWLSITNAIYSYDDINIKWTKYDSSLIGIDGAYDIINIEKTGEVFFCSDKGLIIYQNGKWTRINHEKIKELPSDRVYFAKRDAKNRIWIGTFSGSIMIDETGKAMDLNVSETPLKNQCITSMDEDEEGNLYFGLFEYGNNIKGVINRNEGFAIRNSSGEWKQYTTSNSGIPFNHTTKILYDKVEKVLWIATDRAGLVRYDLKNGWENYHNKNSDIPTSYISDMSFDTKGNLYLATRQGLVRIERK